jgi:hypothetical protein
MRLLVGNIFAENAAFDRKLKLIEAPIITVKWEKEALPNKA